MTQSCCDIAIDLWQQHQNSKIIMSTGDNQFLGVPNSDVMVNYAKKKGVPQSNLISEKESVNTYENLIFSKQIINKSHPGVSPHITLVAYDLHMRRVVATAKKIKIDNLSWISGHSSVAPAYGYKGWLQTRNRLTICCYDVLAIIYSKICGWI